MHLQDTVVLSVLFVRKVGHQAQAMFAMSAAEARAVLKFSWCALWLSYCQVSLSTFYADHCGKRNREGSTE